MLLKISSDNPEDIKPKITCPLVILAANRKESVRGRTKNEINSTKNKNGDKPRGAPLGIKVLKNILKLFIIDEKKKARKKGSPKHNVIIIIEDTE